MTVIQQQLLRDHLDAGGHAMLMSATLGSCARIRWTREAQPDFETACATPYPAIWTQGETAPRAPAPTGRIRTIYSVCRKTPFLEFEPVSAVKFDPDLTGGFRVKWT